MAEVPAAVVAQLAGAEQRRRQAVVAHVDLPAGNLDASEATVREEVDATEAQRLHDALSGVGALASGSMGRSTSTVTGLPLT